MNDSQDPAEVVYGVGEAETGIRLDLFLKSRIPRMSREGIKTAIGTRVRVPGRSRIRPSTQLAAGEKVLVARPGAVDRASSPEEASGWSLPVLGRGEGWIAVDKPAGLRMHASASRPGPSLLAIARSRWGGEVRLVHRLDRETSGLVILAAGAEAARFLSRAFASSQVAKRYLAVVFGEMEADTGVIDRPLGPAAGSAVHIKQAVLESGGKPAVSEFRVLERRGGFSMVEVAPRTGRRHQIRVHMAALGHPLVGDKLYGKRESHHLRYLEGGFDDRMRREILTDRQLLHAAWIGFPGPAGPAAVELDSPMPADMQAFFRGLAPGITAQK